MMNTLARSPALLLTYAILGWFALDTARQLIDHLLDTPPPSRLIYQHPRFVDCGVRTRAEAQLAEIRIVTPGQEVCRWIEWQLDRPATGVVHRTWVSDVIQYQTGKPNVGKVGRFAMPVRERVPAFAVATEMPITLKVAIEYPRRADDPRPHWVYNTPDVEALLVPGKP